LLQEELFPLQGAGSLTPASRYKSF